MTSDIYYPAKGEKLLAKDSRKTALVTIQLSLARKLREMQLHHEYIITEPKWYRSHGRLQYGIFLRHKTPREKALDKGIQVDSTSVSKAS